MKILDIMLDLETFGVGNNPVIIQLSAVPFDIEAGLIVDEHLTFNMLIEPMSCVSKGLTVNGSTVEWWLKQNMTVIDKVFVESVKNGNGLSDTLNAFSKFLKEAKEKCGVQEIRLWGNGLLADNKWLESAYEACKIPNPWKYHEHSDVRTLVDIGLRVFNIDPKKEIPFTGEKHNAIDDCKHQIKYCSEIYKRLQGK